MINEIVKLNRFQQISVVNNPVSEVDIAGRGTGKSFIIGWEIRKIVSSMPRSITSITGKTYEQILTRTLPSTFKFLETLGIERNKDFVVREKPLKGWLSPYEKVNKYDHFISFRDGTGFLFLSQDRIGSGRGPNLDREIIDEALTIDKNRYDMEVSPANRGNEEHFGFRSAKPVRGHHGFRYVSSMPYEQSQKWLLDYGKYYETEAGIDIFVIWNRIVKLQLQLIEAFSNDDRNLFKEIWNEVVRLKQQIVPFTSKDGVLFTLSNAFDNIENLGLSYLLREYKKLPMFVFMVEILNWIIDQVEDCYYKIDNNKHVYYDAGNNSYIENFAHTVNFDLEKIQAHDCRFDNDVDLTAPLEVCPDWGGKMSLFTVGQERYFNFVTKITEKVDCTINEFFVKTDESAVMIDDLVDKFCQYYQPHTTHRVTYFRDRYGDNRQPNAKNSKTYNQQAIERFKFNGWTVEERVHKGMEPPQHDKYLLWQNILAGNDPRYPKAIFNGTRCRYTLISMNNTKVMDKDGKFEKDKSPERKKSILPEEATHFGDAVDKRFWSKYGNILHRSSTFVDARFGK